MFSPLSPQTTFNPQVNSVPVNGQAVQQGGPTQTAQWSGLGSVAYQPNTQNQMQSHLFPGQQGPGQRTMSEWTTRPVEQQIGLTSQATSERNQALMDGFINQRQLLGAYAAVRGQIGPLQQENTQLRDELSQRAPFSQEALSPFFQRMQRLSADHAQLVGDNASQLELLGEIKTAGEQATFKLLENTAQIASLKADKQNLEEALEQLQTTLAGVRQDLTTENGLNDQLRLEVAAHREALTQTQVEVNTAQANVGRLEDLLAQSRDLLTQSREEVNSLTNQLTGLEQACALRDTEIAGMKHNIEQLQQRGVQYQDQVVQAQETVKQMETERRALDVALTQVRGELQEATTSKLQYQKAADDLRGQLESAMAQLQQAGQAHATNVHQIQQNYQQQLTLLQTEMSTLTDLLERTKTEKSELEGQLQGGIGREAAEALTQELAEKDTTIQRLDGEISRLKGDLDRQETEHEHGMGHLTDELALTRNTLQQQIIAIADLQTTNRQIFEQVQSQRTQTDDRLRELQQQIDSVRAQTSMNTKNVDEFGAKLNRCLSQLEQVSQHSQSLATLLEDLRELNIEFNGEGGLKRSNEATLSALDSLQSQVSALQQEASDSAVTEGRHSQVRMESSNLGLGLSESIFPTQQRELGHLESVTMTRNQAESLETLPSFTRHTLSQPEAGPMQVTYGGGRIQDFATAVGNLSTPALSSDQE